MIVRQIFSDYVHGMSPRRVAVALNKAGVSGPRGGKWTASLSLGNAARQTGILRNRLYVGELVWNRQRFAKDPTTGRRVARPNPREDWVTRQVAELRIVEEALWAAAQARLHADRLVVAQGRGGDPPYIDETNLSAQRPFGARLASVRRPGWLLGRPCPLRALPRPAHGHRSQRSARLR